MTKKFQLRTLAAVAAFTVFSAMTAPLSATLLDDAVWFEREVGDGLVWKYYHFDNLFGGKQSVSFIEVDLDNPNVDLAINFRDSFVGPSPGVSHEDFPRARTSILAPEIPGAKAAVNGTYFNTQSYDPDNPSTPWGGGTTYLKVDGDVIHTFDGSNVNRYLQGILFNDKNDLEISRKTTGWANVQSNWQNMMISGPVLIDNGVLETYDSGNTHANARHPRTAIGLIDDTNTLILLTVDGRT
ncbi:MAG: phosphodiester glycosidase family protein, partial [Candidatus Sumerlaeia bacterium]|nr:phosphodiester glycosidase family protein [Candidatus Sumerlaeia bacterium]